MSSAPTPSDTISLTGLRVFGHHGVFEDERINGQDFVVDLTLTLDLSAAAASDDVADTVHYGILAEQVNAAVANDPANLLEKVAQRIADVALAWELVQSVTVTLHKPQAPITVPFSDVTVTITRERVPA